MIETEKEGIVEAELEILKKMCDHCSGKDNGDDNIDNVLKGGETIIKINEEAPW